MGVKRQDEWYVVKQTIPINIGKIKIAMYKNEILRNINIFQESQTLI